MKALAIAAVDLRRLLRWRANVFFLFVLPMLIILLLGATFGGVDTARIGVLGGESGPLARALVRDLDARRSIDVRRATSRARLRRDVARGNLDAGLVVPAGYDERLRGGAHVALDYLARPDSTAQQLRATVQSAVADQAGLVAVARVLQARRRVTFDEALPDARAAAAATPRVGVAVTAADGRAYTTPSSRFAGGASTQLLLFVFLNSLNGAAFVIETRRLGIARRILATPTPARTFVLGQLLGRLAIALVQALLVILGSLLAFGVDWGDPLGTAALVVCFALVATGAAVLLGSLCSSDQQAGPIALLLGLGLAALGGSMAPLEIFPATARTIAHLTPHAWANDAFSELLDHGGDLGSILPQLGVLLGMAAPLLLLAGLRLRRTAAS